MANINIDKAIGEVSKLNEELKETASLMGKIIENQSKLNTELSKSKTVTDVNKKNNAIKKEQNEVEKQGNKLLAQRNTLVAKQQKALQPLTKEVIKQQEALKEQNKQLREQAKAELGIKKRTTLFQSMTKSILAAGAAIGGVTAVLRFLWKEISRTQGAQLKLEQGLNATRSAMDLLVASTRDAALGRGGFKDFNKRLEDSISFSIELTKRIQALRREQAFASETITKLSIREEAARSIAEDATKSFQEREKARVIAQKAAIKRADEEIKLTKEQYETFRIQLNRQIKDGTNATDEQKKQFFDLKNAYLRSLFERKKADFDYNKIKRELILDDFEQELDYLFDVSDKRKTANEKLIADSRITLNERKKILDETNGILEESFNQQIKLYEDTFGIQIDTNKLIKSNNKESFEYARGLGLSERATNRLLEVIRERIAATSDLEEATKDLREEETKINTDVIQPRTLKEKELTATINDELSKRYEANLKYLEKVEADELASIEMRKQAQEQLLTSAVQLGNTLFDLSQTQRDRELSEIQANYQAQIDAAEGNTERQEQLAAQLQAEQQRINAEQARSEKNQALFNIAVRTAEGIMQAIAQFGLPLATPLITLTSVLGAAQAAAVLAQPIPGFFRGTEDAPAGLKWVAEKGSELVNMPSGESVLFEKPTLIDTPGGEQILNHENTVKALNGAIMHDIAINGNKGIEDRLDLLTRKMSNLKQLNVNYDINGFEIHMKQGNSKITYANRIGRK